MLSPALPLMERLDFMLADPKTMVQASVMGLEGTQGIRGLKQSMGTRSPSLGPGLVYEIL